MGVDLVDWLRVEADRATANASQAGGPSDAANFYAGCADALREGAELAAEAASAEALAALFDDMAVTKQGMTARSFDDSVWKSGYAEALQHAAASLRSGSRAIDWKLLRPTPFR